MTDLHRDKREKQEKEVEKLPAYGTKGEDKAGGNEDHMSTAHGLDEQGNHEDLPDIDVQIDHIHPLGPSKPFPVSDVVKIMKEIIDKELQGEKYEVQRCRELTLTLSEVIKKRVKELQIPRYKLVVHVYIGQILGQGVQIRSGFLWDPSTDTFASYSFKSDSLFCNATVYAVYFE